MTTATAVRSRYERAPRPDVTKAAAECYANLVDTYRRRAEQRRATEDCSGDNAPQEEIAYDVISLQARTPWMTRENAEAAFAGEQLPSPYMEYRAILVEGMGKGVDVRLEWRKHTDWGLVQAELYSKFGYSEWKRYRGPEVKDNLLADIANDIWAGV